MAGCMPRSLCELLGLGRLGSQTQRDNENDTTVQLKPFPPPAFFRSHSYYCSQVR